MSPSRALSNRQVFRAAVVVLLGFLASGVLGFVRLLVVAQAFGTSEAHGAFIAAQRIPEVIFNIVAGGALGSSFIPIYARMRQQDQEGEQEAWRLASAVMTLSATVAALIGVAVIVSAPFLAANVLLPGRDAAAQALTADLMRWMMITPVIFSVSGLMMGILQTHGQFLLPAIAISMNNIGIMIGALFIAPHLPAAEGLGGLAQVGDSNIYGLAYGAILSAVLHALVQLPGLIAIRARLRPLLALRMAGVWQVLRLMGPRVFGQQVVQINYIVNIILASAMAAGSLVALDTAFKLVFFALGLIGQSVGAAVFPTLAALAAEDDYDGFKDRLGTAMRGVLFLALPATVAFIVLGEPIVSLFERDQWTAASTAATAWALSFYALGIAGFALLEILSRAFYALADTWTPVIVGVAAMVANIILSLVFSRLIGDPNSLERGAFAGLALANAVTTLVEALFLWWLMRRRIGQRGEVPGLNDGPILSSAARVALASLMMGAVLLALVAALPEASGLMVLIVGGVMGGGVFFGVSFLLGVAEARAVPLALLNRIKR